MKIKTVPIDAVIPYARNPRRNDAAVDKVAASLREFGWQQPIVVDKQMTVVAGHTRLLAARRLEMGQVPIHVADGLTAAQIAAYRLADNRVHEEADWDRDLLRIELGDLQESGYDLALTGFDPEEIAAALAEATAGLTDPDAVPATPEYPTAEVGDCWLLGRHRLVCGDSTDATVVDKALAGVTPHLLVTDPPYGVEYDPKWRADAGINKNKAKMGVVLNDGRSDWREAWSLFPGDVAYVWHAGRHASSVQSSLEACDFEIRCQIIWAKDRFALSRGHYHWQHEPCWYAVRVGAAGSWAGDRKQSTLWNIKARDDSGLGHSTQKPVECMRRPIENNSSPGQAVYEPFSGSGTTIVAAEMTGRTCHAIELNPAYIDVAVKRWQQFTGKQATLEGDGRTFDEVAAVRLKAAA